MINGGPQRGMGIVQGVPRDTPTPPELWYEFQRLDHFNPKDHSSWQQVLILFHARKFYIEILVANLATLHDKQCRPRPNAKVPVSTVAY